MTWHVPLSLNFYELREIPQNKKKKVAKKNLQIYAEDRVRKARQPLTSEKRVSSTEHFTCPDMKFVGRFYNIRKYQCHY